jgi:hypothetical protein
MGHSDEKRLQDYLDGRLSVEERKRFEELSERDPELAARVEEGRKIRAALREADEELSPGFYTRARARFEESVRPQRRSWFRFLSWETAGLTAAVVLAAVLFVPVMMRDDLRTMVAPEEEIPAKKRESAVLQTSLGAVADEDEIVVAEGTLEVDELAEPEDAGGPPPAGSIVADKEAKDREVTFAEAPPPAPMPAQRQKAAAEPSDAPRQETEKEQLEEKRFAPALPPPVVEAKSERQGGKRSRADVDTQAVRAEEKMGFRSMPEAARAAPETDQSRGQEYAPSASDVTSRLATLGVALAPGLVAPGAVRVVETREEWDELLRGPAAGEIARIGGFDPHRRLVLIGPRSAPLDCGRTSVDRMGETLVIRLSAARDGGPAATHGCGLALPRAGSFVVVEPRAPLE